MRTRLWMNPQYEHLRAFVEQLPAIMDSQGTYIYGGRRNLIKMLVAPDGMQLNVKRFCQPSFFNNIIYSTGLRKPKGWRAFTYPERLLKAGIETPEAVAYLEQRNSLGLLRPCYFVSRQCPYPHRLYEMGPAAPDVYEPMATALAQFAAHMHEAGILHLDFSPGNILWDKAPLPSPTPEASGESLSPQKGPEEAIHFSIVDINRMHFGPVSMAEGCKSFARLWGPKRFIALIAEEYARRRGFDADACLRITMSERARFWRHYMKKRDIEFPLEL